MTGIRSLKEESIPTIFNKPIPLQDITNILNYNIFTISNCRKKNDHTYAANNYSLTKKRRYFPKTIDTLNNLEVGNLEESVSHRKYFPKTIDILNNLEVGNLEEPVSHIDPIFSNYHNDHIYIAI
ncbi:unnamed protein product [Gordionus sp. m RMFG-2023]